MLAAGTIAAIVYNVNRGKDDRPIDATDFVPPALSEISLENDEPEEVDIDALREFLGVDERRSKPFLERE